MGRTARGIGVLFATVTLTVALCRAGLAGATDEPESALAPSLQPGEEVPSTPAPAQSPSARAKATMRAFVDREGVTLMTNRPHKYLNNPNYREITIEYEPIVVPNRYRTASAQGGNSYIASLVNYYSRLYGLDSSLVYAVIKVESNFNPYAVSRAGARGLMQLMPDTAAEMGVKDLFNPAQNIAGGTQYLSKLLKAYGSNLPLALAAYNAGPETVKKYNGIPPYRETQDYIKNVRWYQDYFKRYGVHPAYFSGDFRPNQPRPARPDQRKYYLVRFHSGIEQPAEAVVEDDSHFYIQVKGRTVRISKDRVKEVVEPA